MGKKVGILTYHRSHNCGSMMESFAIQKSIEKLGYNPELINFSTQGQRNTYYVFSKSKKIKKIVKNVLFLPYYKVLKRHYENYEEFLNKFLNVSKEDLDENSNLEELNDQYDMFVAGSDQIWNITITDFHDIYFLPFVKNKRKIAYAPSFGAKNIFKLAENKEKYINYVKEFDYLSIRENNGKKWISDNTEIDCDVVLDPTLLLDEKEYSSLEKDSGIEGDYIFYYCPEYSKKLDQFVKEISKKYNLPVVVWNSKEFFWKKLYLNGFKITKEQSPSIYLDLIKKAKLVITTSFHGTIFSTIYRNKFWVLKNGGMYKDDDRVITLVNELGIEDRLIVPEFNSEFDYFKDVNYPTYEKNLKMLKNKSIDFLKRGLNSEK